MDLVVVDGPNLFNSAGAILAKAFPSGDVKDYFMTWFDLDRFLAASLDLREAPTLGFVIFHSSKGVGRSPYRLENSMAFWGRQGSNPDTSCTLVDLTGNQQETYPFDCEKCRHRNEARTTSEKGIDTAITTHLLDTADRWESACIVSNDIDFVPPVVSLRRRGKRVFCAVNDFSRDQAGTALVQACQSHFTLSEKHLLSDYRTFSMCRRGGSLDRMVAAAVDKGMSKIHIRLLNLMPPHRIRRLYFSAGAPDNRELQEPDCREVADAILPKGDEIGFELENAQGLKRNVAFYGTEDQRLIDGIDRHAPVLTPIPEWLSHRDASFRF